MALHWPTFFTRLGSAIVFAAVMMVGLLWKDWAFVLLVFLIMTLCLREYLRLAAKIDGVSAPKWLRSCALILVGAMCVGCLLFLLLDHEQSPPSSWLGDDLYFALYLLCIYVLPTIVLLALLLMTGNAVFRRFRSGSWRPLHAIVYVILPGICLLLLRHMHWSCPLILILCIWMNDTMAYLVGSFIGKTPFSKISPKKTWEGTAGGAILAVGGAALAAYLIPGQNMGIYIALSLCAAIAGTAGDLYESKLKRAAGVKDSGTMMPGHGGALDRFDSLLFAAPCAYVVLSVLEIIYEGGMN